MSQKTEIKEKQAIRDHKMGERTGDDKEMEHVKNGKEGVKTYREMILSSMIGDISTTYLIYIESGAGKR